MNNTRKYALWAGISILVMALVAGYSYGYVFNSIVLMGNEIETYKNLQSSLDLFVSGIVGWVFILILDLVVAWGIYQFFRDAKKNLALLTAIFRIVYTLFLGIAISYLIAVLPLVKEKTDAAAIMSALDSFNHYWSLGLIVFGLHLISLSVLTLKSSAVPTIFAWLLLFAGISYFGIHVAKALFSLEVESIMQVEQVLMLPMAIGELAFAIWLVIKGGKPKNTK
ncbi:MAG: DUF4386 domain-containing protein [Bacteroidales bacterium]|nr:DUF4386 domain-containing protein [Bacteroidales bacterium]